MKFSLAIAVTAALTAPALADNSVSTTVTVSPCPSSTMSKADIVTRSPIPMVTPSTPCPTLHTVATNGTVVTMSHPGAGSPGTGSGSSTASATPSPFTGAAAGHGASIGGAVAAAFGFAAFVL